MSWKMDKIWRAVGIVTESCVKAGCACFNCLAVCDGHCLNPLSSSNAATAPSASMTSLKAHSMIDQSSSRTPDWNTSVSPCTDPVSPWSIISSSLDRESVYGETPACESSSWTTSPFCSLNTSLI